ncbi:hypothetical protein F5Y00DRAFT_121738 [Daldinia vernicosa]|uniref:uncharacterized protein n=1 Tax=Daldinia vernicosa TaxID=114800 RepID=UPI0020088182|nr:uncharacterized protein F5Y00DRAFT_121738 [Daldinia vernicosa]KAI0847356.1 hypothetical protein F5Y00DRAFT_121738 [Daldinia vernicosa]
MATPGTTEALLAAFFFGILFNAASAGLVLYAVGHGSAIFRDGLRLVLILFLTSSAAWALVEFLATIIEPTAASMCQVAVVFSSIFDQMARVFVEQYLVWAARPEKKSIPNIVSQVLILIRFGVGMAFIGLARSDFNPTCVPISSVPPIAITIIVLDAIILALVAVQVLSSASTSGVSSDRQAPLGKRSVTLVTVGLAIWIGTSVVLLLGERATDLVLRTTLPAVGLAVLVALVTVFSGSLVTPRGPPPRRPDSPTTRDAGRDRNLSSSDSADYPPSRYEDVKAADTTAMAAYVSRSGALGMGGFGNSKKNTKGKAWNKATAGKLVISKPVLISQEGMENPLDRIPTVDLATAAREEKERRVKLLQREPTLIAQRPAPRPPTAPGRDESLARELSLKRKKVGSSSLAQLERTISTKTSAGLSVEANASSTSSELSPGTEQVRRRSPRYPPAPPIPATFQPILPGEPVRIPIPRPRDPSPSPKEPEPVKTPLQRRATTGLPSNPRAQAMKQIAKDAGNSRHETVMFVNNIVYDDPNFVSNIVQGASKTPITSLDSGDSVVHRPRPIPRKGDNDRQVFPAEISPSQGHKRSKSSGSIIARRSMLRSVPGSPSQLPPLPAPPKSAGNLSRLRPIHTKSMSLDEKMDLLFPTPLSAPSAPTRNKQKSIVPDMPPLPAAYAVSTQRPDVEGAPDCEVDNARPLSKTTDRSSTRTTSILGIDDIPQQGVQKVGSSHNAVEERGQSWLPGISAGEERRPRPSHDKMNQRSSPVIPAEGQSNGLSSKDGNEGREGYASTIWGSVHSPIAAVNIQQSRQNAHSTYVRKDTHSHGKQEERDHPANVVSEGRARDFVENNKALPKVPTIEKVNTSSFHRRVGDECPAFSTRKGKGRLRKMPPPAPLLLNGRSNKRTILVQPAEPSPLESPGAAYQMIQAQLQRFEQPNPDSVDSEGQRLALLENLEREMGQLQNKWQSTQNLLQRDSMSSIKTSPAKDSRSPSMIAERRVSRKTPMRIGTTRSNDERSMGTPSSQSSGTSSENTRSSQGQARLASSQREEIEGTPNLIMKHNNLNFLSVSKAALGSPSPPDTEESESGGELPMNIQPLGPRLSVAVAQTHELWKPQPPAQPLVSTGLWAGMARQPQTLIGNIEIPSLPLRSVSRKTSAPLVIESSRLWEKTTQSNKMAVYNGLWKKHTPSQNLESNRTVTRPVTVRPPRRNKRVSLLPDILENPVPLPDKQGTLGLFQFPWGEKSESASIQLPLPPTRMFTAMPGTMTTGAPATNAFSSTRSSQPDGEEFTTSFFDDYEAEEEGDNFDNFEDFSDSDGDDFDENTLWEIASLLRTEVPSRDSLLLLAQQGSPSVNSPGFADDIIDTIVDDYNDDGMVLEDPIPIDQSCISTPDPIPSQALLWTAQPKFSETSHTLGLPQPDSATWESYNIEPIGKAKSTHRIENVMSIESIHLWEPRAEDIDVKTGLLWSACKPAHIPSQTTEVTVPTQSASLWVRPIAVIESEAQGLFDVSRLREDYRRTSNEPAALFMKKKPRAVEMPLEKLVSRALWTANGLVAQSPLLWKTPATVATFEHDGLFNVSIVRSDYRRTEQEPAAISMEKRTARVLREPLASLQTNYLWTKESVSQPTRGAELFLFKMSAMKASQPIESQTTPKFQTVLLWENPKTNAAPEHEGLFDVSAIRYDYRRTSKVPAAIAMSKKSRSNKEPLPSITTTSLWTGETPAPIVESPVSSKLSSPSRTNLLWEQSNSSVTMSDYEGLFDVNVVRIDYRRTSKLPAAINMTRRAHKMGESLTTLMSTRLWEKSVKLSHASTKTTSLWSKPITPASSTSGLFQLDPTRKIYRTTSAEPVALQMSRKPRFTSAPLPIIKSTRLWSNSQTTSVELDWMIISSVRPRSPSVASISTVDSSPVSPVTDSSSVKTSTTKASSAKSTGSVLSGWFGKKKVSKAPEVPELPYEFIVKNLDEIPRKKPTHILLRQLYRPSIAYRADWDNALREAIVSSYPGSMAALRASYPQDWDNELQAAVKASHVSPKITRKVASPRDWSNALHVAIISSYPEIRFSRGQALPSQWNATLQKAIALSEVAQPSHLDVAVRHPVFMGSMETTAETVHPAIGPKTLKRKESTKKQVKSSTIIMSTSLLWEKPVEKTAPTANSLWSSKPMTKTTSNFEAGINKMRHGPRKSNKITQRSAFDTEPSFSGQGMWRRNNNNNQGRDWLEDSMKKRFTRVELRY